MHGCLECSREPLSQTARRMGCSPTALVLNAQGVFTTSICQSSICNGCVCVAHPLCLPPLHDQLDDQACYGTECREPAQHMATQHSTAQHRQPELQKAHSNNHIHKSYTCHTVWDTSGVLPGSCSAGQALTALTTLQCRPCRLFTHPASAGPSSWQLLQTHPASAGPSSWQLLQTHLPAGSDSSNLCW